MITVDDLVSHARSIAVLTADPSRPECRARYLSLVAPGETPERADAMATMSGCELLALRGYIGAFITHPLIEHPYRDRKAGEDLWQVAYEAHSFRPTGTTPQPGDVVIVGGGSDGGGPEHAWICLGPDGGILDAVDGGQVIGGHQAIILRSHDVAAGWDRTDTYRRRVRWVIDTMRVVEAFGR